MTTPSVAPNRGQLESEHLQAIGLPGSAAVLTTFVLGVVAVRAATYARNLAHAAATFEGEGATLLALLRGTAPQLAEKAGQQAPSALSIEAIRRKLNEGLTEAREGMATAKRMRDGLREACLDKQKELDALQSEIDHTRSLMRGCPGVEIMREPPLRTFFIPSDADWETPRL